MNVGTNPRKLKGFVTGYSRDYGQHHANPLLPSVVFSMTIQSSDREYAALGVPIFTPRGAVIPWRAKRVRSLQPSY
jgi:hydrogenase-4 membrane subunit HyfE